MVFNIQQTVYEKIVHYKKLLAPVIKEKTDKEIKIMLIHCKDHLVGRKKRLTHEEQVMHEFILKNGLSANVMYGKFVFLEYPQHIQELLRNKKISMRDAQRMYVEEKDMRNSSAGKELMKEIMEVLQTLQWPGIDQVTNKAQVPS